MGYPSKASSYPDLTNGMSMAKTNGEKLELYAEQLKSVFATKIDLKDKNLERETEIFLTLTVKTTHHYNLSMITKSSLALMS